jgi:nucleoside-diphosphate-sugar epimerase
MKRILVTGASGFLGKHVVSQLLLKNYRVVAWTYKSPFSIPDVESIKGDLSQVNSKQLESLDCDCIINCAAVGISQESSTDLESNMRVNYHSCIKLFEAAELAGISNFIQVGSCSEYGLTTAKPVSESDWIRPTSAYGLSKSFASLHLQMKSENSKIRTSILRLFNLWGPGESMPRLVPSIINTYKNKHELALTKGEQVRDYLFVEDAAKWTIELLEKNSFKQGEIINVGNGMPISIKSFVSEISKLLQIERLMLFGQLPYRKHESMYLVANVNRLNELLPNRNITSIHHGLEKTLQQMGGVELSHRSRRL